MINKRVSFLFPVSSCLQKGLFCSPLILWVVYVSPHHVRVYFNPSTTSLVVKRLIKDKLGLEAKDFTDDRMIEKLYKFEPNKTALRISNFFEMTDAEGLGYFKQATSLKFVDKVSREKIAF